MTIRPYWRFVESTWLGSRLIGREYAATAEPTLTDTPSKSDPDEEQHESEPAQDLPPL
ncbi:hypothetical protein J2T41_004542 [Pseudomonas citronellolis]|uniref:hypothetical protein n=1 Tax=Pseudomonas citronellolis TaxID=53408 RepID=UPI00209EF297|nr:hypothetical protein [Pseudomonas citronellolis]MCP1644903.1 hypothetical protein [Pseudomonas citronellolis]MCP1667848.1 hypothetical protein [Pseudomonas citronellolis]MCP1699056.1 hypothetical protein [Pseudomonas citronellolis]MCP1704955.1 hypothetical protein [Pseudomonas citronellolis]MCP1799619.1 hypothetical protein [Pseudomonas citronellolis]